MGGFRVVCSCKCLGVCADSTELQKTPTEEEENKEWREKYGEEAQKVIRACVDANVADYEYLKSFAVQV